MPPSIPTPPPFLSETNGRHSSEVLKHSSRCKKRFHSRCLTILFYLCVPVHFNSFETQPATVYTYPDFFAILSPLSRPLIFFFSPKPLIGRSVRVWLGRIAGSLITGAILGAAAYSALPRAAMPGSPPMCPTRTAADTTSPWWNAPTGGCESSAGGPEPGFGDRLNKALFAARAGEAAAQQGLLVRQANGGSDPRPTIYTTALL